MKHRKNKIKRQHGIIKDLKKFLEQNVSSLDSVEGIIPGRIKVGKTPGENLIVTYQYSTVSGAKLIARSGTSVQEVFVITNDADKLKEVIEENDGIYDWSDCPHWDDYKQVVGIDDHRERDKLLSEDWMMNNSAWNLYAIGLYCLKPDEEVTYFEPAYILVDKNISVKEFVTEYKKKCGVPIYIKGAYVQGNEGGLYKNIDEAVGPFEFLIEDRQKLDELSENQKSVMERGQQLNLKENNNGKL